MCQTRSWDKAVVLRRHRRSREATTGHRGKAKTNSVVLLIRTKGIDHRSKAISINKVEGLRAIRMEGHLNSNRVGINSSRADINNSRAEEADINREEGAVSDRTTVITIARGSLLHSNSISVPKLSSLRALRDNTGRDKGHLVEISHRRKLTATS
jgi:hypothetical protein